MPHTLRPYDSFHTNLPQVPQISDNVQYASNSDGRDIDSDGYTGWTDPLTSDMASYPL